MKIVNSSQRDNLFNSFHTDFNFNVRLSSFGSKNISVLLPMIICDIPASFFIYRGNMQIAGRLFWILFFLFSFLFISLQLILRKPNLGFITLIISTSPIMNYLRSFGAPYNIVTVVFFAGLVNFYLINNRDFKKLFLKNKLLIFIFIFELIYYALAFFTTHSYSIHLRAFEVIFAAQLIFILLCTHSHLLKVSLLGILLSSLALAIGFIPSLSSFGRLGIGIIDEMQIGNPITLGLPLAFGFLALIIDKGTWVNLNNHSFIRYLLLIPTTIFLALSSSRVSWLIAALGLLIALLSGRKQRVNIIIGIIFVIGIGFLFLQTPQGNSVTQYFNRTFNSDLPMYKRTSGRSDQWIVGWYAFKNSFSSIVGGYGAGLGPDVYAQYSQKVEGILSFVGNDMAWHSLILQIGIELGLLGLIPYIIWLLSIVIKSIMSLKKSLFFLPFACLCGYIATILTVSGYASMPGLFLGIVIWGIYSGSQEFNTKLQRIQESV